MRRNGVHFGDRPFNSRFGAFNQTMMQQATLLYYFSVPRLFLIIKTWKTPKKNLGAKIDKKTRGTLAFFQFLTKKIFFRICIFLRVLFFLS